MATVLRKGTTPTSNGHIGLTLLRYEDTKAGYVQLTRVRYNKPTESIWLPVDAVEDVERSRENERQRRGYSPKGSPEHRAKLRTSLDRKRTLETRAKMSMYQSNRSPEHRTNIALARIGKTFADEPAYSTVHDRARRALVDDCCALQDQTCGGRLEVAFRHDADLDPTLVRTNEFGVPYYVGPNIRTDTGDSVVCTTCNTTAESGR